MKKHVDLIWLGDRPFSGIWDLGQVWENILLTPKALFEFFQKGITTSQATAWLFWDSSLSLPSADLISSILEQPGDVWHAGLLLGMEGLPEFLNYVEPTWMLNLDPPRNCPATSWRISLSACLVRKSVLHQLGCVDPNYDTLAGAALEMGCRYIKNGVFVRYAPSLLTDPTTSYPILTLSFHDELRFVRQFFGMRWVNWSIFRALLSGYSPLKLYDAYLKLQLSPSISSSPSYQRELPQRPFYREDWKDKVTVLIPTLERYPYLRVELEQLRHQTIRPLEILIMDQTPLAERDLGLASDFSDLPIRFFYQNKMGQCTGWNEGLLSSKGDYILFLGDDADKIAPDFLEKFIKAFQYLDADMIACIVDEVGAEPVPDNLAIMRIADSFPIAMVRRSLLSRSGLMDFAFDRGARADQDLGIRCYLAGGLMIVDPKIRILHHHAPRGGLRKHKARKVTYAKSRSSLWVRNLASVTEIYLVQRYFIAKQKREHRWLDILGTFSIRGNWFKKLLKILISSILLPHTIWLLWRHEMQAVRMLEHYPNIPSISAMPSWEDDHQ